MGKNNILLVIIILSTILQFNLPEIVFSQHKPDEKWFYDSYRKLFFDFHTQRTAVDVAKGFDADKWADEMVKNHVQAISLHSVCDFGWKYYRKGEYGYVHPQLPHGVDIIGDQIRAFRERGIRVIAYFNVRHSEMVAEHHPEWLRQNRSGETLGIAVSLMSPYFEEMLLPQLEEFARNYQPDGIFFDFLYAAGISYDDFTRDKYKKATGKELPEGPDDPGYEVYVKWMLDEFMKMRQQAFDVIHRGNKNTLVSINWSYTYRQPEIPPEDMGFLSLDIPPSDQVFDASYFAKYWNTLGRPFDIMNSAFLRWWGDWGVKPAESLMQECATIIANGGRTWIGYQYNAYHAVEPALMDVYRKTFEFIKEREDYVNGAQPVPYIAVLHSLHGHFTHKPTLNVDNSKLKALFKMLIESGFHFNIVNENGLLQNLDQFKLVILPDQRYLEPELVSALREFVRNGGCVIASGLTGTQDSSYRPTGRFVMEDVFGIRLEEGEYPHTHSYMTITDNNLKRDVLDMPQQTIGEVVYVTPEGARILAELWDVYQRGDGGYLPWNESPPGKPTGYPAVTINEFGKGKAAYIAQDIFTAYNERPQWNLKNAFRNLIDMTLPEKLIEIDAPGMVEVVLNKKGSDLHVNLVNHYREKSLGNAISIAEKVIPVHNIQVKVKVEKKPRSVILVPEGKELDWKMVDGHVVFSVPKLHIYSIAVIEQ